MPYSSVSILAINQTAVIMDCQTMNCNKDDSTLFQIIDEVLFYEYPQCAGVGYSNFNTMSGDTILMKVQFHVKQGTDINQIILNNITATISAVKQNVIEEFPLESFTINTSGFLPNCDDIQEINFTQERDFIIPEGDCRNEIRLFRMPFLDIAGYSAYELIYPFKIRWEEWRQLQGASRCFPSPTHNWVVYANTTGWKIKFSIKAEVEKKSGSYSTYPRVFDCTTANPVITQFEHVIWGTITDDCDVPYAVEFRTEDILGINSYEEVIATDVDTLVIATITGDFSGYAVEQLYGILTLDAWGVGGITYSKEIGTHINADDDFVWYGLAGTLVATISKISNSEVTIMALINHEQLPTDTNQFILSGRIGYYNVSSSSSGAGCMNEIEFITFTCGELEIIAALNGNELLVSGEVVTSESRDVFVYNMILTFVTATTWTANGGTINDKPILSGTIAGNIIKAPAHPYTNANAGDVIQGELTGSIFSSITEINGIGDMQIGCTFFVS